MRPHKSRLRADALPTLETVRKQTKEARILRRAQAVREVVAGPHVNAGAATFHVTNVALRKGLQRFATEGHQGWRERLRSCRPRTVPSSLEDHLKRLVAAAPLPQGALSAPWRWCVLATGLAHHTGVPLGCASVRGMLQNLR